MQGQRRQNANEKRPVSRLRRLRRCSGQAETSIWRDGAWQRQGLFHVESSNAKMPTDFARDDCDGRRGLR
jgi:hypothetical protein